MKALDAREIADDTVASDETIEIGMHTIHNHRLRGRPSRPSTSAGISYFLW